MLTTRHPVFPCRAASLALAAVLVSAALGLTTGSHAAELPQDLVDKIDALAAEVLDDTGVPSASLAVVHDGLFAYANAYGIARLEPETPATPAMRYPIGSISKQFTATAVALLAREDKLSLDDTVDRFFPDITRAGDITLRQLLSHTSGIRDYWPQDYVPAAMLEPITTAALIERFATEPLDFEPGSQYQYSNTGYVIAGAIVEKVSGQSLTAFLTENVFEPLGMKSVVDIDRESLAGTDPVGYQRFALGPARMAPDEGKGWLFAAGPLAMTAADLARWNAGLIASREAKGHVPGANILRELSREVLLDNGAGIGYGLGLSIDLHGKRRVIGHGGEVSGFTATNLVYPEERIAVAVLSNQDAANASESIAHQVAELLLQHDDAADAGTLDQVRAIYDGLRKGTIDRSLLTPNGSHYFSERALADIKASLKGVGKITDINRTYEGPRGGLITRIYSVETKKKTLHVVTRTAEDGKLEQYTVAVE